MGVAYAHEVAISPAMECQIRASAENILLNGSYLISPGSCGSSGDGAGALQKVVDAITANKVAETSLKLFSQAAAALPLKYALSQDDLQLCDLRGCFTLGDVANALLQRIVARTVVAEAVKWLWPTARRENNATHPLCWAASFATCTCCCVGYREQVQPFPFGDVCPCGPCCVSAPSHTSEATQDLHNAIHGILALAAVAVSSNWRRVVDLYKLTGIDEVADPHLLTGEGARKTDDINWNWVDMRESVGRGGGSVARREPPEPPIPCGFRVIAEAGVECTVKGKSAVRKTLRKDEEVYPISVQGSKAKLKGGLECSVISDEGVRLLEPMTRHWRVGVCDLEDDLSFVPTYEEKPNEPYLNESLERASRDIAENHRLKCGQLIVSAAGGIDGAWLQAENGRWVPIYRGGYRGIQRVLLPVPEPRVVAKDDPTLKVAPERCFFNPEEFPELAGLSASWEKIRDEALNLWQKQSASFVEFEGHRGWMACALKLWGHEVPDNLAAAPVGAAALRAAGIPALTTFCYSVLEPGAHIRPHEEQQGTSSVRAHLGLRIPTGCSLRVGAYARVWKEGHWLVFNGNRSHEVLHSGDTERVVLLIDFGGPVVHPDQWPTWMGEAFRQRSAKSLCCAPEPVPDSPPRPGVPEDPPSGLPPLEAPQDSSEG